MLRRESTPDPLALAVHRRDEGSFEFLVSRYEKPLMNYVQRLLLNVHDAEEVLQDTFVRAHRALTRQYDEQRCRELDLKPWLFRIARNLSRNKRRGKRFEAEQPLQGDGDPNRLTTGGISILCEIETRQELERLDRAIARLPHETRELIILRFIEEMSYAEIAATIGTTEASLRGKVFRSLRQLRDMLASQEVAHAM